MSEQPIHVPPGPRQVSISREGNVVTVEMICSDDYGAIVTFERLCREAGKDVAQARTMPR